MKSINIYLSLFLITLFFASCEKEIEFNGKVAAPQVVVNSFVTPDSLVRVQVTESRFFLTSGYDFKNIENADISVFVNGTLKEKMLHETLGFYVSIYKPAEGDSIRLVVKVPNKADVSCETKIEAKTVIIGWDTTRISTNTEPMLNYIMVKDPTGNYAPSYDTIGTIYNQKIKFSVRFSDNGNEPNYYRLVVMTKSNSNYAPLIDYTFSFDDIVSGNTISEGNIVDSGSNINPYNVFSDDIFNGKQYKLNFSVTDTKYVFNPGYEKPTASKETTINLQSISKSYYLYLKSRGASENSNGLFSEPIQIYNNVDGGIGILGSYTSNMFTVDL